MKFIIEEKESESELTWSLVIEGKAVRLKCSKDGVNYWYVLSVYADSCKGYLHDNLSEKLGLELDKNGRLVLIDE